MQALPGNGATSSISAAAAVEKIKSLPAPDLADNFFTMFSGLLTSANAYWPMQTVQAFCSRKRMRRNAVFADQRIGRTRIINPGALHRASPKTVALLDTERDKLERIVVAT